MDDCVVCAIVAGRAPAHRLLEDEHTVWEATPAAEADLAAVQARILGSAR